MIRKKQKPQPVAQAVQTAASALPFPGLNSYVPLQSGENRLYAALREAVPIIDAAIDKIIRLIGAFEIQCENPDAQDFLNRFLKNVPVNATQAGVQSFLNSYLSQLLTYGNAVGEMVVGNGEITALYNAGLDDVELKAVSPLKLEVCRREMGKSEPVSYPELVFCSALYPEPGSAKGVSLLHGLPFVSGILLQIYHTIGVNWERLGNVRFAVTYKPTGDAADRAFAKERAQQIAGEWSRAMQKDSVSDFVAVGDVSIKAIGADNRILDSEIPVREMLEQIVAKLGIPPFLLGFSWSSTERMSSQQADILTSELQAYRRELNPVIYRICVLWLRLNGYDPAFEIKWDNITLQDQVETANARYMNAKAAQIEAALKTEGKEE
ncbi:serine/threonine protein phosphatase [Caproiciproducens galactitolivorans]|uniref:Serine/threonine protein phosphatase n=1 Tax=Caproiciproducens galactitolivorans TaxID=642589 RepID=A0ABT4BW10_9FIRM|nr:serine/threonine protein phosphatase [Caproiciproducens galactitolivorans]MCY1715085.1 serine/threonine protein phosphatase [Caproiciproducens galactitolivorans]